MTYKPKSIKEAIDDLHVFLESDLYTKFRPEVLVGGKSFNRTDVFKDEKEFCEYLGAHLGVLRKQIIKLIGKKTFVGEEKE